MGFSGYIRAKLFPKRTCYETGCGLDGSGRAQAMHSLSAGRSVRRINRLPGSVCLFSCNLYGQPIKGLYNLKIFKVHVCKRGFVAHLLCTTNICAQTNSDEWRGVDLSWPVDQCYASACPSWLWKFLVSAVQWCATLIIWLGLLLPAVKNRNIICALQLASQCGRSSLLL